VQKQARVIVIDNYDSFTYNLYQYISEFTPETKVFYNDKCTIEDLEAFNPTHIVISPGPGTPDNPKDIGVTYDAIEHYENKMPILGVCLGHQAITKYYGGDIVHAPTVMHGKQSKITIGESDILSNLDKTIDVMRYHSLMADRKTFPEKLKITSETTDGIIMSFEHTNLPIYGIQFHPESVGTPVGKQIIENFLNLE